MRIHEMRIYLDLDGVMADFDRHFVEHFGVEPQSLDDANMWKKINSYPDFFANLPPMKDALNLFGKLVWDWEYDIIILTACPRSNYRNAAIQKRNWVRKHLSTEVQVIPMLGGVNKALFMHQSGDILIDDMEKNCMSWEELGGKAIIHKNAADTIAELKELGADPDFARRRNEAQNFVFVPALSQKS
jgi:5'-nucleotidase